MDSKKQIHIHYLLKQDVFLINKAVTIPFNLEMSDLIQNIKWAQINDFECEIMVQNANEIAKEYLNEKTMVEFTSIILNKYILRVK